MQSIGCAYHMRLAYILICASYSCTICASYIISYAPPISFSNFKFCRSTVQYITQIFKYTIQSRIQYKQHRIFQKLAIGQSIIEPT